MSNEFLAARVPPWQVFRIKKWAEHIGQPLGMVLTEAIATFLSVQEVPPELTEAWLKEYREIELAKEGAETNGTGGGNA